ncbi:hypothetical protein [Persicirhabdus sediminis]|uniref:Thioredoxin domain-containing protein n=1 Tax=Persicirhabdus sediminis TaxID=454144 RepID=A0A8J7SP35_9BACT|nr:hypothetical protein [Persicirhabdus sediminis]MBK1792078.1 hypothetical protein [Persicirhabdus sediminis]
MPQIPAGKSSYPTSPTCFSECLSCHLKAYLAAEAQGKPYKFVIGDATKDAPDLSASAVLLNDEIKKLAEAQGLTTYPTFQISDIIVEKLK